MTTRRRSEKGASAVEFALVMPMLLILVFGIIAFGIIFAQKLALGNGARQAARYGVVANRTCTDIISEATADSTTIGMAGSATTVTVKVGASLSTATNPCGSGGNQPCLNSSANSNLYVTVAFTSKITIPLVMSKNVPIAGTGVFRCEFS